MNRAALAALLTFALAACNGPQAASDEPASLGASVQTEPPNGQGQTPAFAGQTRAPETKAGVDFKVEVFAQGLERPWGMAFLPDGRLLVSEKDGRLRIVEADGGLSAPVTGLPAVDSEGQGGLFGLALDPAYATNGLIYWSYAEGHGGGMTNTAVGRGRLVAPAGAAPRIEGGKLIYRQTPSLKSDLHYGGRLVFARDGTLLITTGERSELPGRVQAQRLDGTLGKVVRINADGSIPKDNPYVGKAGAKSEIFSIGHRNIQSAALNPATGELWVVDHGARGGDEVNIVRAGKDYGWPTITYGIEYAGGQIGEGITQKAGMEQPIYYWDPVIAPSGMAFYEASLFPAWKGSLFIGGMQAQGLVRLALQGDKVVGEEWLLTKDGERVRDVIVGPDGALYLAIDDAKGRILKLVPKS